MIGVWIELLLHQCSHLLPFFLSEKKAAAHHFIHSYLILLYDENRFISLVKRLCFTFWKEIQPKFLNPWSETTSTVGLFSFLRFLLGLTNKRNIDFGIHPLCSQKPVNLVSNSDLNEKLKIPRAFKSWDISRSDSTGGFRSLMRAQASQWR